MVACCGFMYICSLHADENSSRLLKNVEKKREIRSSNDFWENSNITEFQEKYSNNLACICFIIDEIFDKICCVSVFLAVVAKCL